MDYFGRFSIQNWEGNIDKSILPPNFELKIGPKEPQNRPELSLWTVSYEVAIEKERDGITSASGTIGYETDNGTKIEGEARIDSAGNASGKVSIGGKF